MKTIILAGGMGTRLKNVLNNVPKPMAPVRGKPFLEYVILALAAQGFREIMLSIGYRKDVIRSHFGNGSKWGVGIVYSEEDTPLGTGGSVREALRTADEPHSLILNGDTFNQVDFREMEKHHLSHKRLATIGLIASDDTDRYGFVKINAASDILEFCEKSDRHSGYINRGAYIMDRTVLDHMPASGSFSLENDLFPELVPHGMSGFISRGFFVDIGIPSTYRHINDHHYLLEADKPDSHNRCRENEQRNKGQKWIK
ncbi:MAG: nucleotidyltransferase family protein [Syntrophorhabdaceae bacterium]|nr:nucleotidyltransferase family protein [Syntrophorhabdaceae bacterium]MDD4479670.1 nucleotidyltransferase family protein [Mesotoga sp.]